MSREGKSVVLQLGENFPDKLLDDAERQKALSGSELENKPALCLPEYHRLSKQRNSNKLELWAIWYYQQCKTSANDAYRYLRLMHFTQCILMLSKQNPSYLPVIDPAYSHILPKTHTPLNEAFLSAARSVGPAVHENFIGNLESYIADPSVRVTKSPMAASIRGSSPAEISKKRPDEEHYFAEMLLIYLRDILPNIAKDLSDEEVRALNPDAHRQALWSGLIQQPWELAPADLCLKVALNDLPHFSSYSDQQVFRTIQRMIANAAVRLGSASIKALDLETRQRIFKTINEELLSCVNAEVPCLSTQFLADKLDPLMIMQSCLMDDEHSIETRDQLAFCTAVCMEKFLRRLELPPLSPDEIKKENLFKSMHVGKISKLFGNLKKYAELEGLKKATLVQVHKTLIEYYFDYSNYLKDKGNIDGMMHCLYEIAIHVGIAYGHANESVQGKLLTRLNIALIGLAESSFAFPGVIKQFAFKEGMLLNALFVAAADKQISKKRKMDAVKAVCSTVLQSGEEKKAAAEMVIALVKVRSLVCNGVGEGSDLAQLNAQFGLIINKLCAPMLPDMGAPMLPDMGAPFNYDKYMSFQAMLPVMLSELHAYCSASNNEVLQQQWQSYIARIFTFVSLFSTYGGERPAFIQDAKFQLLLFKILAENPNLVNFQWFLDAAIYILDADKARTNSKLFSWINYAQGLAEKKEGDFKQAKKYFDRSVQVIVSSLKPSQIAKQAELARHVGNAFFQLAECHEKLGDVEQQVCAQRLGRLFRLEPLPLGKIPTQVQAQHQSRPPVEIKNAVEFLENLLSEINETKGPSSRQEKFRQGLRDLCACCNNPGRTEEKTQVVNRLNEDSPFRGKTILELLLDMHAWTYEDIRLFAYFSKNKEEGSFWLQAIPARERTVDDWNALIAMMSGPARNSIPLERRLEFLDHAVSLSKISHAQCVLQLYFINDQVMMLINRGTSIDKVFPFYEKLINIHHAAMERGLAPKLVLSPGLHFQMFEKLKGWQAARAAKAYRMDTDPYEDQRYSSRLETVNNWADSYYDQLGETFISGSAVSDVDSMTDADFFRKYAKEIFSLLGSSVIFQAKTSVLEKLLRAQVAPGRDTHELNFRFIAGLFNTLNFCLKNAAPGSSEASVIKGQLDSVAGELLDLFYELKNGINFSSHNLNLIILLLVQWSSSRVLTSPEEECNHECVKKSHELLVMLYEHQKRYPQLVASAWIGMKFQGVSEVFSHALKKGYSNIPVPSDMPKQSSELSLFDLLRMGAITNPGLALSVNLPDDYKAYFSEAGEEPSLLQALTLLLAYMMRKRYQAGFDPELSIYQDLMTHLLVYLRQQKSRPVDGGVLNAFHSILQLLEDARLFSLCDLSSSLLPDLCELAFLDWGAGTLSGLCKEEFDALRCRLWQLSLRAMTKNSTNPEPLVTKIRRHKSTVVIKYQGILEIECVAAGARFDIENKNYEAARANLELFINKEIGFSRLHEFEKYEEWREVLDLLEKVYSELLSVDAFQRMCYQHLRTVFSLRVKAPSEADLKEAVRARQALSAALPPVGDDLLSFQNVLSLQRKIDATQTPLCKFMRAAILPSFMRTETDWSMLHENWGQVRQLASVETQASSRIDYLLFLLKTMGEVSEHAVKSGRPANYFSLVSEIFVLLGGFRKGALFLDKEVLEKVAIEALSAEEKKVLSGIYYQIFRQFMGGRYDMVITAKKYASCFLNLCAEHDLAPASDQWVNECVSYLKRRNEKIPERFANGNSKSNANTADKANSGSKTNSDSNSNANTANKANSGSKTNSDSKSNANTADNSKSDPTPFDLFCKRLEKWCEPKADRKVPLVEGQVSLEQGSSAHQLVLTGPHAVVLAIEQVLGRMQASSWEVKIQKKKGKSAKQTAKLIFTNWLKVLNTETGFKNPLVFKAMQGEVITAQQSAKKPSAASAAAVVSSQPRPDYNAENSEHRKAWFNQLSDYAFGAVVSEEKRGKDQTPTGCFLLQFHYDPVRSTYSPMGVLANVSQSREIKKVAKHISWSSGSMEEAVLGRLRKIFSNGVEFSLDQERHCVVVTPKYEARSTVADNAQSLYDGAFSVFLRAEGAKTADAQEPSFDQMRDDLLGEVFCQKHLGFSVTENHLQTIKPSSGRKSPESAQLLRVVYPLTAASHFAGCSHAAYLLALSEQLNKHIRTANTQDNSPKMTACYGEGDCIVMEVPVSACYAVRKSVTPVMKGLSDGAQKSGFRLQDLPAEQQEAVSIDRMKDALLREVFCQRHLGFPINQGHFSDFKPRKNKTMQGRIKLTYHLTADSRLKNQSHAAYLLALSEQLNRLIAGQGSQAKEEAATVTCHKDGHKIVMGIPVSACYAVKEFVCSIDPEALNTAAQKEGYGIKDLPEPRQEPALPKTRVEEEIEPRASDTAYCLADLQCWMGLMAQDRYRSDLKAQYAQFIGYVQVLSQFKQVDSLQETRNALAFRFCLTQILGLLQKLSFLHPEEHEKTPLVDLVNHRDKLHSLDVKILHDGLFAMLMLAPQYHTLGEQAEQAKVEKKAAQGMRRRQPQQSFSVEMKVNKKIVEAAARGVESVHKTLLGKMLEASEVDSLLEPEPVDPKWADVGSYEKHDACDAAALLMARYLMATPSNQRALLAAADEKKSLSRLKVSLFAQPEPASDEILTGEYKPEELESMLDDWLSHQP